MNLGERFFQTVSTHADRKALRWKEENGWRSWTYAEMGDQVRKYARGLLALGLSKGDRVAILSRNRPEWAVADLGAVSIGCVTVPIYSTSTPETIRHILDHSESRILVLSAGDSFDWSRSRREQFPRLDHVILLDPAPGNSKDPGIRSFSDIMGMGQGVPAEDVEKAMDRVDASDISTLMYTSGTTGKPKGVMLTHRNVETNASSMTGCYPVGPSDVVLSSLPMSHAFERTIGMYMMLFAGAEIAYAESLATVPQNLLEVRPTIMLAVPRMLEKFYGRIHEAMDQKPTLIRWLFKRSVRHAEKCRCRTLCPWVRGSDRLFFKKIRERMGGRMRLIGSGGAALSEGIARFFGAVGLNVLQGYGLTETSPVMAANRPDRNRFGTVGPAIPDVDIKIADDGEVLVRGPNVMKGYYKDAGATAEVFTPGGWFKTGDIGEIDADGFLRITDRKKEMIKTSGGKYIAPQPMENELKLSPLIEQACIVGEGQKYVAALIVPNFSLLETRTREEGIQAATRGDLVANSTVREWYSDLIKKFNENRASYETIKRFELLSDEWTIQDGEITPTLKLRRKVIAERHATAIENLFR
ncbi:MAG TPA: long-chain fatty acid--CoA ligase [Bdellovibrionota bacterium]|nr:long-chain fatty acid--CoA ligase [Bdellovibrionota bacterium]